MTVRTIVVWPSPILNKSAELITEIDDSIVALAQDLVDTMNVSFGAGLAATQIGELQSIAVIKAGYANLQLPIDPIISEAIVMINPQLEFMGKDKFGWEEACLSIPDYQGKVRRFKKIKVSYSDLSGSLHEFILKDEHAGVVQHETDHLIGKLFVDRMTSKDRRLVLMSLRRKIQTAKKSRVKFLKMLALEADGVEQAPTIGRPKRKKQIKKKQFGKNKKRSK